MEKSDTLYPSGGYHMCTGSSLPSTLNCHFHPASPSSSFFPPPLLTSPLSLPLHHLPSSKPFLPPLSLTLPISLSLSLLPSLSPPSPLQLPSFQNTRQSAEVSDIKVCQRFLCIWRKTFQCVGDPLLLPCNGSCDDHMISHLHIQN